MANPINKTVLITGITGFTGKHLESFFVKKGFTVHGTSFSEVSKDHHWQCDILNFDELTQLVSRIQPNYVIHLAAISFANTKDIPRIYDTNVRGTLNLLDAILESGCQVEKIIVASSAAVYGNIGDVLSEEMCPKPVNHYGNSKLAMENMVANYFDRLNIIVSRPFNYTGVGQEDHFLIPKIVKHFKDRKSIIELGNLNTFREYNDVKFLVECYFKLLNAEFDSETVNIASGKTYSIRDILTLMEDITGHSIQVRINKEFVRKNEIKELKGSPEKLLNLIGESDSEFRIVDTLKEMYLS